jgi:hypothetical protein
MLWLSMVRNGLEDGEGKKGAENGNKEDGITMDNVYWGGNGGSWRVIHWNERRKQSRKQVKRKKVKGTGSRGEDNSEREDFTREGVFFFFFWSN